MAPPKSPPGITATVLSVTVGLLLPGALAGQQGARVPIPSLERPRTASPPDRPAGLSAALSTPLPPARTLALADGLDLGSPGTAGEGARLDTPTLPGETVAGASDVPDAVFHVAAPARPDAGDARRSLGSLGDVLPRGLCRDLLELRARIRRYRTVLFGPRGIVRWGEVEGREGHGRVRLNLQADPHPGLRVTLVTR